MTNMSSISEKDALVEALAAEIIKLTKTTHMPWFAAIFALGIAAKALTIHATNNGSGDSETNMETGERCLTGGFSMHVKIVSTTPEKS